MNRATFWRLYAALLLLVGLGAATLCARSSRADRPHRRTGRTMRSDPLNAGSLLFAPDDVIIFVNGLPGQSNDNGVNNTSSTPVTTVASSDPYYVWCQNGATNEYENDDPDSGTNCWNNVERPGSALLDAFAADYPTHTGPVFYVVCSVSGQALTYWWNGTAQTGYTNCTTEIDDLITYVDANAGTFGLTTPRYRILGNTGMQGESDFATNQATYRANLEGLLDAFDAYAMATTGQAYAPFHVLAQPSTFNVSGGETEPSGGPLAQIEVCRTRSNAYCSGPTYAHDGEAVSPWLHLDPANHRLNGEIRAQVMMGAIAGNATAAPLIASTAVDNGVATICFDQTVEVDTTVGTPTLGTRTGGATANYGCPAHPGGDYGLEVLSTGTPPTLSNCTLATSRCFTCDLSSDIVLAEQTQFAVAWTGSGAPTSAFGCQAAISGSTGNAFSNIRNPTTTIYAQHDRCGFNDGGTGDCITYRDAGVDAGTPDSGTPDSGTPDGGVVYLVYGQDQSWADPGSVYGLDTTYQTAYECSNDAGPCAYWYDEVNATARVAFEATDAGVGTYIVPTAQTFARALDQAGGTVPVGLVVDAFPGTPTDSQSTTNLAAWDDAVAAAMLSDYSGACVWPLAYIHGGGGYQMQSIGDPFSDWTTAVGTYLGEVRTSAAALTGVCGDWASTDIELMYNGGGHQAWGQAAGTWYQHGYSGSFDALADGDNHFCGQMSHIAMGADELHPNATGAGQLADLWGTCLFRYATTGQALSMHVTSISADADTVTLGVYTPCVDEGTCVSDPPITYETTAMAEQQTEGDVATGGLHFLNDGGLQQPASAGLWTFGALSTCDGGVCPVTIDFDGGIGHFDEITLCDIAEGPDAGPSWPRFGGCNAYAPRVAGYANNPDGGVGDWLRQSRHAVASYDGGTPDSGAADSGVDGGVSDAGTLSTFQNLSSTNLDDSDDYYTLTGGMTSLDSVSAYTICWWDREGTRGVNEYIFGEYTTSNRKLAAFSRIDELRWYTTSGTGTGEFAETTDANAPNDVATHWCVRFDGGQTGDSNRMRIWSTTHAAPCAGACERTLSFTGSVPAQTTAPASGDFYIGAATSAAPSWGSATSYFDELAIWTSALTAAQIEDEIMVGAAVDLEALATAAAPTHWYRFETGAALTDTRGAANLSSSAGSPTLATTPQVRTTPNTQFYNPSANSDYLSLATFGGAATYLCHAGWFEIGNQFDAVINQWGGGGATEERQWSGHNPSGVQISAFGDGTANGGRQFNLANTGAGATTVAAGQRYHLASCFDGATPDVIVWMNGVLAAGGTQDSGSGLVSSLATDRQLDIGQATHARDADDVILMAGRLWTDAEVCGLYCATRTDTDAVSVTGSNGAADCDCDAVNIDEGDIDLSGFSAQRWHKLDGDLTDEFGGSSLTDQDTANYTDN